MVVLCVVALTVPAGFALAAGALIASILWAGVAWWRRPNELDGADAEFGRDGCLTMNGRLPFVHELTDPTWLGVHAAREVTGTAGAMGGKHPPYVPRDLDGDLRERLASGGFILLVGDSTAGKTRAAAEAVAVTLPNHTLIAPQDRTSLPYAVERASQLAQSVLWLDELERWLGADGLTPSRVQRLLNEAGRHRVVVATIRASELDRYTHTDEGSRPTTKFVLDTLALAQRIDVRRLWSQGERNRAAARTWDPRITEALDHSDRFGVAEYLAAGPELLHLWGAARDGGPHVRGAALVAAAVDCRRAGLTGALPGDLLERLVEDYLPTRGGIRRPGEEAEQAWEWATRVRTTTALLTLVGTDTYEVFDYLVDETNRTATGPVPDVALRSALSHADATDSMRIGTIARTHGRYEIALTAYSQARSAYAKLLGPHDRATLTSWGHQAAVLRALGRLEEAENEHRAVLEARIRVLEPDDPSILSNRNNLALVLYDRGRLDEAEAEYRAVLDARVRVLGRDHPSTLTNRNNLAFVLHDLGRVEEAENEHCAVLAAYAHILRVDGRDESDRPMNIAAALKALGRLEDAEAEHHAVLDTSTRVFGPDHPDAFTSRGSPTLVLHGVERLDEAESQHREVYDGFTRVLGPDHPSTLTSRSNLAVVLHARGRVTEAEVEHRAVVDGYTRVLGAEHPSTLTSRSNLAVVLHAAGRITEAETEHRTVVAGFSTLLGHDHPSTLTGRNYLAAMLQAQHRAGEAEGEHRAVVEGFMRTLGPDHPSTLTSRSNLAVALHGLGRWAEARTELEVVVEGFTKLHGAGNSSTLTCRSYLAITLHTLGLGELAAAERRIVLDGFASRFGATHPYTRRAHEVLSALDA